MKIFMKKTSLYLTLLILISIQLNGIVDQKNGKDNGSRLFTNQESSLERTSSISSSSWITRRLTNNSASLTMSHLAVSGNCVHVIFLDEQNIYLAYKRSTDGGATWEARQNLSTLGSIIHHNYSYSIAADGPYVHVVMTWFSATGWNILYRRNTNYGKSGYWGSWRQLTTGSGQFTCPSIALDGEYVHIAYQADWPGNYEIFYKRISNYGVGSSITRRLTYSATGSSQFSRIATSAQYVYIVYQDDWPGDPQIFFKRISSFGTGSITTRRLTNNLIKSEFPDIAAFGQYVFVCFKNYNPSPVNNEIFSKTLENYGIGNITTRRLTYAGNCYHPSIAFDSITDNVQVVYDSQNPGNYEIFWKVIPNFGKGSYSTYRLTYSFPGTSAMPDIEIKGGTTHIVYQDNWPGSNEIFYKRR